MTDHGMHHGHHHADHLGETQIEDTHDTHGMLIVGDETVYLSHLPMFGHPNHDIQAILEVTFASERGDPQTAYAEDRRRTGTKMYTFVPEKFILSEFLSGLVFSPDPKQPPPPNRFFKGRVVQGHFERGGKTIIPGAIVEVTNVVHARQFDPDSQGLSQLTYLLFGKGRELFLAHLITKPPDFDQILSVRAVGHDFTDEELGRGVLVVFPGRANSISERIRGRERVMAETRLGGDAPETVETEIEADTELYFEEGELGLEADLRQTEAERSAGF